MAGTLIAYREVTSSDSLTQPSDIQYFGVEPSNTRYNLEVLFPTSQRTITYSKCRPDGLSTIIAESTLIRFLSVIESPEDEISCTVPPSFSISDGQTVQIESQIGNAIQVQHSDLGDQEQLAVTLTVASGSITINDDDGIQPLPAQGNALTSDSSGSISFTGTLENINFAIASISLS